MEHTKEQQTELSAMSQLVAKMAHSALTALRACDGTHSYHQTVEVAGEEYTVSVWRTGEISIRDADTQRRYLGLSGQPAA